MYEENRLCLIIYDLVFLFTYSFDDVFLVSYIQLVMINLFHKSSVLLYYDIISLMSGTNYFSHLLSWLRYTTIFSPCTTPLLLFRYLICDSMKVKGSTSSTSLLLRQF